MTMCNNCFELHDENADKCSFCGYKKGDPPKELYHLFPGTELRDRYIIGMVLGFGGFGITYKAWDKRLETIVAIKEYYPSGIVNRTPGTKELVIYAKKRQNEFYFGKERFLEEARNMAKFNKEPNIVNVYEFFEENNTAYIVMEFLDGISISKFMNENEGILSIDTCLEITAAIANALNKLHSIGIIHRDVSPDNIFYCCDGSIKLIDFGAARFSQNENKLMTIILTPGFAPPEQYQNVNDQGAWTDVYALGATLYYMITGVKPDESTNRKIKDTLSYPDTINPKIPKYISNSIMKAMAVDIHMRFKDIKEFLEGLHQGKKVLPVETEKKKRKRKRSLGITAAFVILVSGIFLAAINWEKEKDEETLPPAEITMWYCKNGDKEADEAEESAYQTIIEDFKTSFADVKISLQGFEKEEYIRKLKSDEQQPNIYEFVDQDSSAQELTLESIYRSDTIKQCRLLDHAHDYYENYNFLPLGFNVPVFYCDTVLYSPLKNSVSSIGDLDTNIENVSSVEFDYQGFQKFMSGSSVKEYAFEDFVAEKTVYYGSLSSSYQRVTDEMPARYKILFCDTEKINCVYDNVWAANDIDRVQNKASLRLLEFMLNNNAQDHMHIRNRDGNLPVNDAVLDVYVSVFTDFDKCFENKDKYIFEK